MGDLSEMSTCAMCGEEFEGEGEYWMSCADYIRQSYEDMEREEYRRMEYEEEMRRDAFGDERWILIDKCDCYHTRMSLEYVPILGGYRAKQSEVSECWGTKERETCYCGGDKHRCTFYQKNREEAKIIHDSEIKQFRNTVEQLELFDKVELCAIKIFIKQLVGENTYNQKVSEIYQKLKCE